MMWYLALVADMLINALVSATTAVRTQGVVAHVCLLPSSSSSSVTGAPRMIDTNLRHSLSVMLPSPNNRVRCSGMSCSHHRGPWIHRRVWRLYLECLECSLEQLFPRPWNQPDKSPPRELQQCPHRPCILCRAPFGAICHILFRKRTRVVTKRTSLPWRCLRKAERTQQSCNHAWRLLWSTQRTQTCLSNLLNIW